MFYCVYIVKKKLPKVEAGKKDSRGVAIWGVFYSRRDETTFCTYLNMCNLSTVPICAISALIPSLLRLVSVWMSGFG